jgi:hypothetical protein
MCKDDDVITDKFKKSGKGGDCSDYNIPLYTHPAKELHLSLQKTEDGELVAVTYTDDEHRIVEVLWKKPPAKTLTDEEILDVEKRLRNNGDFCELNFARALLIKAQEK